MVIITAGNGVKYLMSEKLGCPHGFSTRVGGVSRLPHTAALNLAFGRGDDDPTVLENLKLFADAVGFDAKSIVSGPQIHSAVVRTVMAEDAGKGYFVSAGFELDGYVTTEPSVTLGVKTADCVPILLSAKDSSGRVIAVAALHSGWRGTAANIAGVGVERLLSLGAKKDRIFAAIGPAIGQCCFEIDRDCRDRLAAPLGKDADAYIVQRGEKYYPDLPEINRKFLIDCGVLPQNIDLCRLCTACRTDLFYSHRQSGGVRGTMLSAIRTGDYQ